MGADTGGTAGAPRTRTYAGLGTVYAGLSDEEVEVSAQLVSVLPSHGQPWAEQSAAGPNKARRFPPDAGRHSAELTGVCSCGAGSSSGTALPVL